MKWLRSLPSPVFAAKAEKLEKEQIPFRLLELIFLYGLVPAAYTFIFPGIPLFFVIMGAFAVCLTVLLRDPGFRNGRLWAWRSVRWSPILLRFSLFAILSALGTWWFFPEKFLYLPQNRPFLMVLIALFYPLFSAYPQEVIYRSFFYHRYADLLPSHWAAILVNALLFAFAHLIFGNWPAIAATFLASLLFSRTYHLNHSTPAAFAEHSLYGVWIYFIGIGDFLVRMG